MKEKQVKKRKGVIFALALAVAFSVVAPMNTSAAAKKNITVAMKGVKISKGKATLTAKKEVRLTVKYKGQNVTSKASYKSSRPKIVSVGKKGKLTAKNQGKCTITVKYKKMSKKLNLTVKPARKASFPVGRYSVVSGVGYYRGSLDINSAGIATFTEWSGGTGRGTRIEYQMKADGTAGGVRKYSLRFIKGNEIQLKDSGFNVTGRINHGENRRLSYDTKKDILKEDGIVWEALV